MTYEDHEGRSRQAAAAASWRVDPDLGPRHWSARRPAAPGQRWRSRHRRDPARMLAVCFSIRRGAPVAPSRRATSPMGTLTAKIQRHPAYSVMSPPSTQPLAPPPAATAVHQPTARRRPSPGSLSVVSSASAAGESRAAPAPWRTRAATSAAGDHANAQPAEAAVNRPRPIRNVRRRPTTSATRPPKINSPPNTSAYAVNTHCSPASVNPSA